MDFHLDILQRRCRLCGKDLKVSYSYEKGSVSKIIGAALGVDVLKDDNNVYPSSVCGSCYLKLKRWKQGTTKKSKAVPLNIDLYSYAPHVEGCTLCSSQATTSKPDVQSLAREVSCTSQYSNFAVLCRSSHVYMIDVDEEGNSKKTLIVQSNGSWSVRVYGNLVKGHTDFAHLTDSIKTRDELESVLTVLKDLNICPGNSDIDLSEEQLKGMPAFLERFPSRTIRHNSCNFVTKERRCGPCSIYRSSLSAAVTAASNKAEASTSQFAPLKHVPREELRNRLKKSQATVKTMRRKIDTLERRISNLVEEHGEVLPPDQSSCFQEILTDDKMYEYINTLPENSPQKLLFEQQMKAASSKPTAMRWHPALLRLCIAVHSKSASAYNLIRKSGFINLPHENTLRNYTHFSDTAPGFNGDLLKHAVEEYDLKDQAKYKKNVCLLMDEMKIKSGLVFNSTGRLVGFCDLGEVNNELKDYENSVKGENLKLASHVFVLMARGLFSNFKCPFAYFPCENMTSDQLYSCVWEGVQLLECYGLQVRAITSDGASSNRKFYELCTDASKQHHWTWNPFAKERKVFFFSDPPHLIKTVRNNFANSGCHSNTRNLMFRGQQISWQHIQRVYDWDLSSGSGLRKLYKISSDHLNLTPSSRMRVSLATQVLSATMANALESQGLEETESTRYIIRMMDLFFDCLNVSSVCAGKKKRKPSLEPYRSADDWRFTFLEDEFLSFLHEWETEGKLVPGLSRAEKGKLCLSKTTMDGLVMTVKSFTALARELLAEEGVEYLLSEKLSQDPLEEHFGKQRGMGGRYENPDARQFGSNMQVLQVAGSCVTLSARANVKRQTERSPMKMKPLPKRTKLN
ncbi:uncharacterized protein [Diadema antillarum]|uniref:uncharacterized protein n=1 Tax=Diadema antillarum TaxID=105358 RepID=UPI003A8570D0